MSKITKLIFAIAIASTFLVSSCRDTKKKTETTEEHGHEHDADGNHMHDEPVEQEEFHIKKDSTEPHKHEDGAEHHDH